MTEPCLDHQRQGLRRPRDDVLTVVPTGPATTRRAAQPAVVASPLPSSRVRDDGVTSPHTTANATTRKAL
jgi:hypothetical protein